MGTLSNGAISMTLSAPNLDFTVVIFSSSNESKIVGLQNSYLLKVAILNDLE